MKGLITETKKPLPRIVIFGEEKIGKSTFCAQFPNPIFLDIEDGLNFLAVDYKKKTGKELSRTPVIHNMDDLRYWLNELSKGDHNFSTLVIDSLDWLENLVIRQVCEELGIKELSDVAYGGAYNSLETKIRKILNGLDKLLMEQKLQPVLIAHSSIRTVSEPGQDSYDKYSLKLSKKTSALIKEWADVILAARRDFVVSGDGATSDAKPMLYCGFSPAVEGGGRMQLSSRKFPLNYKEFIKATTGE